MKISAELIFPTDYYHNVSDEYIKARIGLLITKKIVNELIKNDVIEFKYR